MPADESSASSDEGCTQIYTSDEEESAASGSQAISHHEYVCPFCGTTATAVLAHYAEQVLSCEDMTLDNQSVLAAHEERCDRKLSMTTSVIEFGFGPTQAREALEASQWRTVHAALDILLSATGRVPITMLSDDLISWIAYRGTGLSVPAPKDTHQTVLNFLGCCCRFRKLRVPVQLHRPLYHVREYPPSRFKIVGITLSGDAIDAASVASLRCYGQDLLCLELNLCRMLKCVNLGGLPKLRSLCLDGCVRATTLDGLPECRNLTELKLIGCFHINSLAVLPQARKLNRFCTCGPQCHVRHI
jgi:hypothetical protein